MTIAEFRAWFEGYTENISDKPSAAQWERIKERVNEITPQPIWIDPSIYKPFETYEPPTQLPYTPGTPYFTTCGGTSNGS